MHQQAEYPETLDWLVENLTYKENWDFELDPALERGQGSTGHTLVITILTPNSYNPKEMRRVAHLFPVPPAAYDERSWRRWLFEQIHLVELHEAMEFYTIDGEKPYAPSHGPGNDPYMLREVGTVRDQRTSFRGKVNM
jgi:hypothetical protein